MSINNMKSWINKINKTPMAKLKDRHFNMRPGTDEFSKLHGENLHSRVSADVWEIIKTRVYLNKYQDLAARWYLRGLQVDKAIRKALTTHVYPRRLLSDLGRMPD